MIRSLFSLCVSFLVILWSCLSIARKIPPCGQLLPLCYHIDPYSEPHSQNRICDAYLENRLTCSLLIEAASPLALNSYKKPRIQIHPIGTNSYPRYHPNSLCEKWKLLEAIFTFTIRLLTHVTSEETSYPTKSSILPVCGSRGNFDSAWTSGSFSAGGLPSLSGK